MTKEEIREGIQKGIKEHLLNCFEVKGCRGAFYDSFADSFSKSLPVLLDGEGVVIKGNTLGSSHPHLADYFTVESLID